MGYWGFNSYDNDACHDILDRLPLGNKYTPDTIKLEHLLSYYCLPSRVDTEYYLPQELYLGVVIWGLHHNVVVARKRLQYALKCTQSLMNDKQYLVYWKDSKTRVKIIQQEVGQIQKWLNLSPKEFKVQKAVGSI